MMDDKRLFLFRRNVLVDTGSSFSYFPTIEYKKIEKVIIAKHKCYKKPGTNFLYCKCGKRTFENWPVFKV